MRQAGTIPDRSAAERFAAYLLTLGITGRIDQEDGGWVIWVHDDQQWQRSRDELTAFLSDPEADRYRQAEPQARQLRREQELQQQRHARNMIDMRRRWQSWTDGRFPLTVLLIVLSVALSVASNFGENTAVSRWLYIVPIVVANGEQGWRPALGLGAIWHGELWRLFSPMFLHFGWVHLAFDMYWTYQFGALIETRRGSLALLGIVLATGVSANIAQYVWSGPFFGGMSGVGFGTFGYVWMKSRFDLAAGIRIDSGLVFQFLAWLVLCFTGLVGPIANAAHTCGLLSGMAIGYAPVLWRKLGPV